MNFDLVNIRRLLATLVAATLALGLAGCSVVSGTHEIDTKFRVKPKSDASFFGWTEISVDDDPKSVEGATLSYVTLRAQDPPNADLRFIKDLKGEAVTPEKRTQLVSKSGFPAKEPEVALDVDYHDDIRDFFSADDKHKIRIEWKGATDPNFNDWPENGFEIRVVVGVKIED